MPRPAPQAPRVIDLDRAGAPVLVTGAAGFIGFHLVERLLAEGHRVVGVDSLTPYYDPALKAARLVQLQRHDGFRFHRVDVADMPAVDQVLADARPEVVIHMAAQAGVRHSLIAPGDYLQANLVGFGAVLEACRRHDVRHLVYASSSSVYGATSPSPFDVHEPADHPVSLYAATKRANELMAHSYSYLFGLPTTGLRLFTVYGPWGRPDMAYYAFAEAILDGRPLQLMGDGSAVRDFTFVDDVVEGIVRVADHIPGGDPGWDRHHPDPATSTAPFRVLNIGHGAQATVAEMIAVLEELTGRVALIDRLPTAPGDVPLTHARTEELHHLTGYVPTTDLRDGLASFVSWLAAHRQHRVPLGAPAQAHG